MKNLISHFHFAPLVFATSAGFFCAKKEAIIMYGNNIYGGSILPWFQVNILREAVEKQEVTQGLKKICQENIVRSAISLAKAESEAKQYPDQEDEDEERFEQRMQEMAFDSEIMQLSTKILILCEKQRI